MKIGQNVWAKSRKCRFRTQDTLDSQHERRSDIRQAEEYVVAANAQIGVAKANFFPNISLTGTGGLESNVLSRFISTPSEAWSGIINVSQPLFAGGALRGQLRQARAQWQESVLSYQAAQRSDQLSLLLYRHGGASYLQVLTNDTNYFSAELNLVQAQLNERLSLVQLYQALGGGWQQVANHIHSHSLDPSQLKPSSSSIRASGETA